MWTIFKYKLLLRFEFGRDFPRLFLTLSRTIWNTYVLMKNCSYSSNPYNLSACCLSSKIYIRDLPFVLYQGDAVVTTIRKSDQIQSQPRIPWVCYILILFIICDTMVYLKRWLRNGETFFPRPNLNSLLWWKSYRTQQTSKFHSTALNRM